MQNRIKEIRNVRGLSLRKLELLTGYSKSFISAIENKDRNFSLKFLERIAEALEVQPQKLICPCCSTNRCSKCHYNNYRRKLFKQKKK